MKRTAVIILTLLTLLFVDGVQAQTQNGVVKTRGRMENGKLVPGTALAGATVLVEGRQAMLAKDGNFSFPVKDGKYILKSVTKQGYQLVDAEACRQYQYSKNPLTIVMETPDRQMQDKLKAERKIRRQLQDQLREKEDEIEELREQNRLTEEQYRNALQELYTQQQSNEKLIADMAKRYSELDYDQLDEFQRQVSYCIENGQLAKADSILRSRGDVAQQVEASLKAGAAIQQQREQLQKAEAVHNAEIEEMARRCYSYYELFAARFENDSAARYLELRARLDTTNVQWQLDAGEFFRKYIADYDKSMKFYNIALRQALAKGDKGMSESATVYGHVAELYYDKGDYTKAQDYNNKVLSMRQKLFGKEHADIAESYFQMAAVYRKMGDYPKAMEYHKKALTMREKLFGPEHADVATSYHNIGTVYYSQGDYAKALEHFNKALAIREKIFGNEHPDVAASYLRIANVYDDYSDYAKALDYHKKALAIREKIFGNEHPTVAASNNAIGVVYKNQSDYPH